MSIFKSGLGIDPSKHKFPHCILWSPLPPITWILPFIGHTGISDSEGVIYDFAGPYTIGKVNMAFGAPTRYYQLDPEKCRDLDWDRGVREGCSVYSQRMHNIFCDNCHSHVAKCLNLMGYGNVRDRGMVTIGVQLFFLGRFVGIYEFIITFLPFTIAVIIIVLASSGKF